MRRNRRDLVIAEVGNPVHTPCYVEDRCPFNPMTRQPYTSAGPRFMSAWFSFETLVAAGIEPRFANQI